MLQYLTAFLLPLSLNLPMRYYFYIFMLLTGLPKLHEASLKIKINVIYSMIYYSLFGLLSLLYMYFIFGFMFITHVSIDVFVKYHRLCKLNNQKRNTNAEFIGQISNKILNDSTCKISNAEFISQISNKILNNSTYKYIGNVYYTNFVINNHIFEYMKTYLAIGNVYYTKLVAGNVYYAQIEEFYKYIVDSIYEVYDISTKIDDQVLNLCEIMVNNMPNGNNTFMTIDNNSNTINTVSDENNIFTRFMNEIDNNLNTINTQINNYELDE
jgi:hypothetical protein